MKLTFRHNIRGAINDRTAVSLVFVFNAAVLAACLLFFIPMAINNDDSIIHGITAGAYGEFSSVTAHTNYLFASLLVFLQKSFPGVNWFAVTEVLLSYFAFGLAGSVVVMRNKNILGVSITGAMTLLAAPDFYLHLHNTKIAPVAAAAGVAALIYGVHSRKPAFAVAGGGTALFASFLRLNAFMIGAAFAAGLGLVLFFGNDRDDAAAKNFNLKEINIRTILSMTEDWRRKNKVAILTFSLFLLTVIVFAGADVILVGAAPGGANYREYNAARGMVSDFALPDYNQFSESFTALGISENDYSLVKGWNFADLEKFDTKTLEEIAGIAKTGLPNHTLAMFIEQLLLSVADTQFLFAATAAVLCLIIGEKRNRLLALWPVFIFILSVLYMSFIGRITHWVMSGVTGSFLLMEVMAVRQEDERKGRYVPVLSAVILTVGTVLSVLLYAGQTGEYRYGFNTAAGSVYNTLGETEENLYIFDHDTGVATSIHRVVPTFSAIPKDFYSNSYSLGGWDTVSPAKNSILNRYEIESSPYRALIEQENVFLIDTKTYIAKLTFIRENYDEGANISLVNIIDGYPAFGFTGSPENYSHAKEDLKIAITETAIAADENIQDFTYLGVSVDGRVDGVLAAYLMVADASEQSVRYYRARFIDLENSYAVMASIRLAEMLSPYDCTIAVLFRTKDALITTASVPLLTGE